jgi:hypothetical protein
MFSPLASSQLTLMKKGQKEFAALDARQGKEVDAMLNNLPPEEHTRLIESMRAIYGLPGSQPEPQVPYILRLRHPSRPSLNGSLNNLA